MTKYKDMNTLLKTAAVAAITAIATAAGAQTDAQPANDSNTPLHLLKPAYKTGCPNEPTATANEPPRRRSLRGGVFILSSPKTAVPTAAAGRRRRPGKKIRPSSSFGTKGLLPRYHPCSANFAALSRL